MFLQVVAVGLVVALLDEKPVLALLLATRPHADQRPGTAHSLAVEPEGQLALLQGFVRIADRLPGAAIPEHDGAAAIFPLRDGPLEIAVLERVILRAHR
jgi:hypothetical protein